MATHSPILMAYPGAPLTRLTKYGVDGPSRRGDGTFQADARLLRRSRSVFCVGLVAGSSDIAVRGAERASGRLPGCYVATRSAARFSQLGSGDEWAAFDERGGLTVTAAMREPFTGTIAGSRPRALATLAYVSGFRV